MLRRTPLPRKPEDACELHVKEAKDMPMIALSSAKLEILYPLLYADRVCRPRPTTSMMTPTGALQVSPTDKDSRHSN